MSADPTTERDALLARVAAALTHIWKSKMWAGNGGGGWMVSIDESDLRALRDRLVKAEALVGRAIDNANAEHAAMRAEEERAEKAEARVARLMKAGHGLFTHTQHRYTCNTYSVGGCSCGLAEAMNEWADAKSSAERGATE